MSSEVNRPYMYSWNLYHIRNGAYAPIVPKQLGKRMPVSLGLARCQRPSLRGNRRPEEAGEVIDHLHHRRRDSFRDGAWAPRSDGDLDQQPSGAAKKLVA